MSPLSATLTMANGPLGGQADEFREPERRSGPATPCVLATARAGAATRRSFS